jgi:hypothetical protein
VDPKQAAGTHFQEIGKRSIYTPNIGERQEKPHHFFKKGGWKGLMASL